MNIFMEQGKMQKKKTSVTPANKSLELNNKARKKAILSLIGSILLLIIALIILTKIIFQVKANYRNTTPKLVFSSEPAPASLTKPILARHIVVVKPAIIAVKPGIKITSKPTITSKQNQVVTNTRLVPTKSPQLTQPKLVKITSKTNILNIKHILNSSYIQKSKLKPTPAEILNNTPLENYTIIFSNTKLNLAQLIQQKLRQDRIITKLIKLNSQNYQVISIKNYTHLGAINLLHKYKDYYASH